MYLHPIFSHGVLGVKYVPIAGSGVVAVVVVEVVVLVVAAVDLVVVFGMKAEMAVVTEICTQVERFSRKQ